MSAAAHHPRQFAGRRQLPWLAIAPGAVLAFFTMASPSDDGLTLCPVALMTGTACPGCGMSRAIAWLLRGDLERSLAYHPLAPIVLAIALAGSVWALGRRFKGWRAPAAALVNLGLVGLAALLVATWVTRLITGTLPPV